MRAIPHGGVGEKVLIRRVGRFGRLASDASIPGGATEGASSGDVRAHEDQGNCRSGLRGNQGDLASWLYGIGWGFHMFTYDCRTKRQVG